jgi:primary-amine oxidase
MDARNFLRFLFLFFSGALVLLYTWVHLPYDPPSSAKLLLLKNPLTPTRHRNSHVSDVPRHPLDPLTVREINQVRTILSSHALFKSPVPYALHSIELEEPEKPLVLQWKKGDPLLPRKATVSHV